MSKKRDYSREYARYQGKPEQIKRRSERNKARRIMTKRVGKAALRGKDVDHKRGVGAGNSRSNLRVMSRSRNRGYPRTAKGRPKYSKT